MRVRTALAMAALVAITAPALAAAEGVDWNAFAALETIIAVTNDEDGDVRETTIWILVLDGAAYIRTGGSRWGQNIVRDPNLVIRVEEREIPVSVDFISDEEQRERIVAGFREKYGFSDALISPFRGGDPKIMHLTPRDGR